MYDMPRITLNEKDYDANELAIARKILNGPCLRASRPEISFTVRQADSKHYCKWKEFSLLDASAAYVWRNVAFCVSPISRHHCMPVSAEFYLPIENHNDRRNWMQYLDNIVDKIVDSVPKNQWSGIARWAGIL
jgi:hypothetical protein